jgi:hypothetical protein
MFSKLLIANRGVNLSAAQVAAQAHVGTADVMPKPHRLRAQRVAIEPRH